MATPNLFVLGAGKCGTTSLHRLLNRHPDIMACTPKEPTFFCSYFQVVRDPVGYFNLFDASKRYRVDASHAYLSNPETPPLLRDLFPDAKFLISLRQPKARAHSLFQHMRRALHEDGRPLELVESFHRCLQLEAERFQSPEFLSQCRQYFWNFMYMRSSVYDVQMERYFSLFPRDRFLVMSLAEIQQHPDRIMGSIGEFLGVDPAGFGPRMPTSNFAPAYPGFDPACEALMEAHFGDLTARVDGLVGRPLDWSL